MELDLEKARKIIQEEQSKREQEFINEYNELCQKYGFQITPQVNLVLTQIQK